MTILDAIREWWMDLRFHAGVCDMMEVSQQRDYYLRKVQERDQELERRKQPSGVVRR